MTLNRSAKSNFGISGEAAVVEYLQEGGFSIKARNFSCRYGEIDVIAQKDNLIILVEVKTRAKQAVHLTELVTATKQKKIIKTARYYQLQEGLFEYIIRCDVALVIPTQAIINSTLNWIKHGDFSIAYFENAFHAEQ